MRVLCIIQARTGSTRLPEKILLKMPDGRPMLHWVIERARAMKRADDVIVAVPYGDFTAAECAKEAGVAVAFGPTKKLSDGRNDVLKRYWWAASEYGLQDLDIVVRVTSDCPLLDPDGSDQVIARAIETYGLVFCENTRPGVDGLDTEAFGVGMLKMADIMAEDADDRHHVTPWMRRQEGRRHVSYYEHYEQKIVLSVNTQEDFKRVFNIAAYLMPKDYAFASTLIAARRVGEVGLE